MVGEEWCLKFLDCWGGFDTCEKYWYSVQKFDDFDWTCGLSRDLGVDKLAI